MGRPASLLTSSILAALLIATPELRAQDGSAAPADTVQLQFAGSVNVRSLPRGHATGHAHPVLPFLHPDPAAFQREKQAANISSGLAPSAALTVLSPNNLTLGPVSMAGMSIADSFLGAVPPDPQIAVSPNWVVEAVNTDMRIWSRSGNTLTPVEDVDFFFFFPIGLLSDIISDPTIYYDPASDRWFLSTVSIESLFNRGDWQLAVSQTNDPTGNWFFYDGAFKGVFPDYPRLGFSSDKIAITGDLFTISTQAFKGTAFLVSSKADLVNNGATIHQQYFKPNQGLLAIHPAVTPFPTVVMAANGSNKTTSFIKVWFISGSPGTLTTKTAAVALGAGVLTTPPGALEAGNADLIETNDSNVQNAVYDQANNSLWVSSNTGCTPTGDAQVRACIRLDQIGLSPFKLLQGFTFGETGEYYYYPAIQVDSSGNLLAAFNRSSMSEEPNVYVSGQKVTDGLNTFEEPALVNTAPVPPYAPSSATFNRWGDYNGLALDPVDGKTVWMNVEYAADVNGDTDNWGTWIATANF